MPSSPTRTQANAVALAIVLLGFLLRVHDVGATSMWLDEAASWDQARRPLWGMILATSNDNYPPLHNLILHVTMRLFGDSMVAMRMPSVILCTATIWLLYRLGADLFDRTTGLIAALLLSVSVYHIWYSIEARMYALLCFTAVLYVWSTVHAWGARRLWPYLWCMSAAVLLLYSHVYGALILVAVNAMILAEAAWTGRSARPALVRWLIAQAAAAVVFLPWAYLLLKRVAHAEASVGWIPDPTIDHVSETVVSALSGPHMVWAIVLVVASGLVGAAVRTAPPAQAPALRRFAILLVVGWLVIPMGLALLMSNLLTPLLVDRYLIGMLPALYLLLAAFVTGAFTSRWARAAAVACLSAPILLNPHPLAKPVWRDQLDPIIQSFRTLAEPGDIVLYVPYRDRTFEYYVRDHETFDLRQGEAALTDLATVNRVWLVGFFHAQAKFTPLMARLAAAGLAETYNSGDPTLTFSLFTRPDAAQGAGP